MTRVLTDLDGAILEVGVWGRNQRQPLYGIHIEATDGRNLGPQTQTLVFPAFMVSPQSRMPSPLGRGQAAASPG